MQALLKKLQIDDVNPGGCTGTDAWVLDKNGSKLVSYNPTTLEPIASVV